MKKCPFCAEEIQDEAIVCRYCGRDLFVTTEPLNKNIPQDNRVLRTTIPPPKHSAWNIGAKVAAVITVLAAIGIFTNDYNLPTFFLYRHLIIDSVLNFFIWWFLITGIIAVWRKAGESSRGKALIVLGILFIVIGGILLLRRINESAPAPMSMPFTTIVPTSIPTSTPPALPKPTISPDFLFFDDYSYTDSGWYNGTSNNGSITEYVNGGYRIYIRDNHTLQTSILKSLDTPGDVRIEVDAHTIGGNDQNTFGIICRFQSDGNYYYIGISNSENGSIWKYVNGEVSTLYPPVATESFSKWKSIQSTEEKRTSEAIHQRTAAIHLRADCIGNTITLYVNDVLIFSRERSVT